MKPRVCPYCLHIETDAVPVTAVHRGKRRDGTMIGGCACHACDGLWDEYSHRDGRTTLRLRNGRMVDEDELRIEAEAALKAGDA